MLDRSIDHLAEADAEHGLSDEEDEDEDICGFDNGRHQQDATEAKGRDDACSDEQSRTKRNRDRYDNKQSGLNDVDAVDHINDGRHQYGTDEETKDTVGSLLGKLRDLHVAMRRRHCQNLQRVNAEVLELQRKVVECAKYTDPTSLHNFAAPATRAREATAVVHNEQLLSTLADLANGTCVAIDVACRTRVSSAPQHESNCIWWASQLQRETEWLTTLACQDRVAVAASTRGKVLRLAALLEPGACQFVEILSNHLESAPLTTFIAHAEKMQYASFFRK